MARNDVEKSSTVEVSLSPDQSELFDQISAWLGVYTSNARWKDWHRRRLKSTLLYDSNGDSENLEVGDFDLPDDVRLRHNLILGYLELHTILSSLRDCEFYFRRYPFHELPVSKHDHLVNICEMYFSRFYQFRERLKKVIEEIELLTKPKRINGGHIIKVFDRTFRSELKERNISHHRERYSDVAIDKVRLTYLLSINDDNMKFMIDENSRAYRSICRDWVKRVRSRSKKVDDFIDALAKFILTNNLISDTSILMSESEN